MHVDEVRVDGLHLRSGGWPVAGDDEPDVSAVDGTRRRHLGSRHLRARRARGVRHAARGLDKDASPLGVWTATPWASTPAQVGRWWVTAVCLAQHPTGAPTTSVREDRLTVTWPDGHVTTCTLPDPR